MKRSMLFSLSAFLLILGLLASPAAAFAQAGQPQGQGTTPKPLTVYTAYPSQMIGFGEVVTVPVKLQAGTPQTVNLEVKDLPDGWNASFRGGSQIVDAVYVDGTNEASVDLRLEQPQNAKAGKYTMMVVATGKGEKAELPLSFTIKEKLPPRLTLSMDGLPSRRGGPDSAFTFSPNLKNEGGQDLVVTLSATQPDNIKVTIEAGGQEVNELQVAANETKNLTVKAQPLIKLAAGKYPFTVQAVAGDVKATLDLTAEVVGEGTLSITAPDGKLSGTAVAGQETPLKVTLSNTGTAPLRGIDLSSNEPSGWSVKFDQQQIAEIPAGQSVDVTARIKPPDKAVAGDYMVTINARPVDTEQKSADFRITVQTSTLWGIAGIGLIALAMGVVGVAVVRFGRR